MRSPLPDGYHYLNDTNHATGEQCPDPYDVPNDAPAPSSYDEALSLAAAAYEVHQELPLGEFVAPNITASSWEVKDGAFSVVADLSEVIGEHGRGVYTVKLRGKIEGQSDGTPTVISTYSIFLGIPTPSN